MYNEDVVDRYTSEDSVKVEKEKVDPFWMNAVDYGDKYISVANTAGVRRELGFSDRLMKPKKYATCRMAFMNTPVLTLLLFVLLTLLSCNGGLSSNHEVRYSPDGKDSIAYVQYYDGKQYNNIYMGYELFKDLYDDSGYEAVYDYYLAHELPAFAIKKYSTYKRH